MDNKELFKKLKTILSKFSKTQKILLLCALLGVMLLIFAKEKEVIPENNTANLEINSTEKYINNLEKSLSDIICAITGESDVKIMITAETSSEKVYAKETLKKGESTDEEYVIVKNSSQSQSAVMLKEIEPNIKGAVVVTSKAGNPLFKEQIIDAVMKVLGINASQVSVVPLYSNKK